MKNLRLLVCAVLLTVVLGLMNPALAQTSCNPGEMLGPPCPPVPNVNDDSYDPGIIQTPPAADTVDVISDIEVALIELLILW